MRIEVFEVSRDRTFCGCSNGEPVLFNGRVGKVPEERELRVNFWC